MTPEKIKERINNMDIDSLKFHLQLEWEKAEDDKPFDPIGFLEYVKEELKKRMAEYKNPNIHDIITELINEHIEGYYYDNVKIMVALRYYDWEKDDLECTNINQVAYNALYDHIMENIDINEYSKNEEDGK